MKCSILQWNVWYREQADNILAELIKVDADIICLQELTSDSYINPGVDIPAAIARLGYEYDYHAVYRHPGEHHYHMGNGIFSKFPIRGKRLVYLQQEKISEGQIIEGRIYMEVTLETPGGLLTVGTAHLAFEEELLEPQTDLLLSAVQHHRERFVFTGDLNVPPNSATVKRLDEKLRAAGPSYDTPTWPTKHYEFHGVAVPILDRRLDYLFTTPDIRIAGSQLIHTEHSDHLPILLEVEL
jgi:endonuclease/exonuclease/phosphatase family metal-dependent hydrolase